MTSQEDYRICAMFYVRDTNKGLTLDNLKGHAKEIIDHLVEKGYSDMRLVHNPRDENQAFLMVPKDVSEKVSNLISHKYNRASRFRQE